MVVAAHLIRNVSQMLGVDLMRQIVFAGLFAVGLVAIASPSFARSYARAPAAAAASAPDRYCLQGDGWGYPGNCEFSTYDQCRATASGTTAGCGENPQSFLAEQRRSYLPLR